MNDLAAWLDGFVRDPSFLAKYPYYAAVLARMAPVADPSVSRMAVSIHGGRFYLHVNVDAFVAEPQYLRGVLLHEVHHVVLGHLTHPKFEDPDEPELMEIALEISANEHIDEPLPSPIVWRAYANVGIRPGQSTIDRYERLVDVLRTTGARPRPIPVPGDGPSSGGAARGTVLDDHRFLRRGDDAPGGVAQTRKLVKEAVDDPRVHEAPRPEGLQEPTLAGRSPGRLLEELGGGPAEPAYFLDWKEALKRFVARARSPVHTWSRPSRRFPGSIGRVPGRTWAPRALARPKLLVAIDTSLSMTRKELQEIARQLVKIGEHATVIVAECDVEVTRIYPFAGDLPSVAGRGGTDLRPVFAPSILGSVKPDGVVYFTDGDGPAPATPPPVATIWVLTKPHDFRCPWGERAWLTRDPGAMRHARC